MAPDARRIRGPECADPGLAGFAARILGLCRKRLALGPAVRGRAAGRLASGERRDARAELARIPRRAGPGRRMVLDPRERFEYPCTDAPLGSRVTCRRRRGLAVFAALSQPDA